MKVAARITVATALVVALASAAYAYFDLRGREAERRTTLDREARAVASALRANLEVPPFRPPTDAQQRDLSKASGWRVSVIVAGRAALPADSDVSDVQLR